MISNSSIRCCATLFAVTAVGAISASVVFADVDVIDVGSRRQLFVGQHLIEKMDGIYLLNRRSTFSVIFETASSTSTELGQQIDPTENTAPPPGGS
jgi:hypothetical protein